MKKVGMLNKIALCTSSEPVSLRCKSNQTSTSESISTMRVRRRKKACTMVITSERLASSMAWSAQLQSVPRTMALWPAWLSRASKSSTRTSPSWRPASRTTSLSITIRLEPSSRWRWTKSPTSAHWTWSPSRSFFIIWRERPMRLTLRSSCLISRLTAWLSSSLESYSSPSPSTDA